MSILLSYISFCRLTQVISKHSQSAAAAAATLNLSCEIFIVNNKLCMLQMTMGLSQTEHPQFISTGAPLLLGVSYVASLYVGVMLVIVF